VLALTGPRPTAQWMRFAPPADRVASLEVGPVGPRGADPQRDERNREPHVTKTNFNEMCCIPATTDDTSGGSHGEVRKLAVLTSSKASERRL